MAEQTDEARENIARLREGIDDIDRRIVALLNERAKLALAIRDLKPAVNWSLYDPKREEEIFENLTRSNDGPLFADGLREIYEAVLHVMKEL
ncbi:MAG: chorismate mutase [Coriobacteriia bacterium]